MSRFWDKVKQFWGTQQLDLTDHPVSTPTDETSFVTETTKPVKAKPKRKLVKKKKTPVKKKARKTKAKTPRQKKVIEKEVVEEFEPLLPGPIIKIKDESIVDGFDEPPLTKEDVSAKVKD